MGSIKPSPLTISWSGVSAAQIRKNGDMEKPRKIRRRCTATLRSSAGAVWRERRLNMV
jgi:hypothetical protein